MLIAVSGKVMSKGGSEQTLAHHDKVPKPVPLGKNKWACVRLSVPSECSLLAVNDPAAFQ